MPFLFSSPAVPKTAAFVFAAFLFFGGYAAQLRAEAVFLKDGAVVEGKILTETNDKVTLELANKAKFEYQRKDILRVLYHSDYREKRYLTKSDGTVLEVYLVDEKRDSYTYRRNISSILEVTISKDEVESVSKKKPSGKTIIAAEAEKPPVKPEPPAKKEEPAAKKKETVEKNEKPAKVEPSDSGQPTADLFRLGGTIGAPASSWGSPAWGPLSGVFLDVFFYRMKDANGTGLDFLLRVQHNEYGTIKDAKLGLPEVIGYTLKNDSVVQQNSVGAGARYSLGAAAGGIRFQGYALAYYQYSRVTADLWYIRNSGSASGKKSYAYNSHGVCGGIGVEASLRYAGVFAEYTWGYSPAFENSTNVESGMFRAGVTIRTPLL